MPVTIGKKAESDFTNPLGLITDCHRRIEYFLNLLATVTKQAQGGSLDDEQRTAMEKALSYFQNATPKHTSDEEESLFPRMRASGNPQAQAALATLDALDAEHAVADEIHRQVATLAQQWLNDGSISGEQTEKLAELLNELSSHYQRHMAIEENDVFPLAARVLEPSDIEAVGREMAARRGVTRC
jgi:hemerythrin-like domain-containing protein